MTRVLAGMVVATLWLTSCGDHGNTTVPRVDADAFEPVATITVDEDGFEPERIEIEPGDTVELVNEGSGRHSFTAAEGFDTGELGPGERVILRLEDEGAVPYRDELEPDHRGVIEVRG